MTGEGLFERLLRVGFKPQETRLQIDWMTHTDEQILERLAEADEPVAPSSIAGELDKSAEYVADRCRQLSIRDLLDQHGSSDFRYTLAERGRRYLDDEIDPEELTDEEG